MPDDTAAGGKERSAQLEIQPITFDEACQFIDKHHSTHDAPQGWKFGCAVNDGENVVGVVTVGRPVARHYQDGYTLEVTRCCTDGTKNAASKLYAAAWRAARALGYRRLITYTINELEDGTCLNAAGWEVVHERAGGDSWDRPSRPRVTTHPEGQKTLWEVNGNDPSENIAATDGGTSDIQDTGSEHGGDARDE